MAEFMFVNLNNPTQNKRREVRKLVRSHVSYMQHSQRRTELGQVQKPSKSRYTDRSVNGWAVLDDSIAARSSLQVNSASGLHSGLLPQHQSTPPGPVQVRSPRQMYKQEPPAAGKSRRRPRQSPRQPKAPATPPPIPVLDDEVNAKQESPQPRSTLSIVKSEAAVTVPEDIVIKQEPEDHRWDIVPQHSSRSHSLSSSSASNRHWKYDESLSSSPPPLYFNLGDPTDELRNQIELSGLSMSSVMAFLTGVTDLMGPDCDKAYSLPRGSLQKHLMAGIGTDPAARAGILLCAVGAMSSHRREPLGCASLFSLRGYAITCIQTALSDPNTCHSDHTALAIASLGNFEVIAGSEEAYRTHVRGVACIKVVRGGSLHWVLDGVLSWMANLRRQQISKGTITVLDRPTTAT